MLLLISQTPERDPRDYQLAARKGSQPPYGGIRLPNLTNWFLFLVKATLYRGSGDRSNYSGRRYCACVSHPPKPRRVTSGTGSGGSLGLIEELPHRFDFNIRDGTARVSASTK